MKKDINTKIIISCILIPAVLYFMRSIVFRLSFYNFYLEFLWHGLCSGILILIAYFGIEKMKKREIVFSLMICFATLFLIPNDTREVTHGKDRAVDLFNEREKDFKTVQNYEKGWLYSSLKDFSHSLVFPVFDGNTRIVEVSTNKPIFISQFENFHTFTDTMNVKGVEVFFHQNNQIITCQYQYNGYKVYGYTDTGNMEDLLIF